MLYARLHGSYVAYFMRMCVCVCRCHNPAGRHTAQTVGKYIIGRRVMTVYKRDKENEGESERESAAAVTDHDACVSYACVRGARARGRCVSACTMHTHTKDVRYKYDKREKRITHVVVCTHTHTLREETRRARTDVQNVNKI